MEIFTALSFGFVVGMSHALEADHLTAITTMANERDSTRRLIARGAIWGVGHSTSLLLVSCCFIFLGLTVSGTVEAGLEFLVGLMIAALGAHVLWRLRRDRIHLHAHQHGSERHFHFHSHQKSSGDHADSAHQHPHHANAVSGGRLVLSVGLMHGLAGSAAFIVLLAAVADSAVLALSYLAVFSLGSIVGMAALTSILSLPLGRAQRLGGWFPSAVKLTIGGAAVLIGGMLAAESLATFAASRG